ncbi:hypothetical protein WN51_13761 [Melipona quadrifasciata]|uniref:Uncharacterized protein n=1 Tax=Melipona quadrifasciata TaxID=166423 RepID=A0A0M9A115_9HYME|nr:hypothetical protein WN51_13761 [Melipona quadrifasciata]
MAEHRGGKSFGTLSLQIDSTSPRYFISRQVQAAWTTIHLDFKGWISRCRGGSGNEFEITNFGEAGEGEFEGAFEEAFENSPRNLQISDDFLIKRPSGGTVARKYGTAGAVYWQLGCSSRSAAFNSDSPGPLNNSVGKQKYSKEEAGSLAMPWRAINLSEELTNLYTPPNYREMSGRETLGYLRGVEVLNLYDVSAFPKFLASGTSSSLVLRNAVREMEVKKD